MKYKPYPAYKDSGVEWLGKVPDGWEMLPLKRLAKTQLSNVDKHSVDGEQPVKLCNYVDVYKNERITADIEFMSATASDEQIKRLSIRHGDVLITKDSETPDDIGVPALVAEDIEGVVCGYHLALLRPRGDIGVGGYLARLLTSTYVRAQFATSAVGMTRYGLGKYDIENVLLPAPSTPEQTSIATFLDRETAKLDTLIARQEKLIELLQEKRQALISHAVTKGLSPDAPMKDSGVQGLGEVPESWRVMPLKYVSRIGNGSTPNRDNLDYWTENGYPWLNSSVVNLTEVTQADQFVTKLALQECHLPIITPPAVLVGITGQGKTRGMATVLKFEATINQHVAYIKPVESDLFLGFLLRLMEMSYGRLRMDSDWAGSTKGAITCEQLGNLSIVLPTLQEQIEIVDVIDRETAKLDTLIEKSRRSIELMREHRTALISAAVTGKIDVREAA